MLRKPARVSREDAPPALVLSAGGATVSASPPDKLRAGLSSIAGQRAGVTRMRGRRNVRGCRQEPTPLPGEVAAFGRCEARVPDRASAFD